MSDMASVHVYTQTIRKIMAQVNRQAYMIFNNVCQRASMMFSRPTGSRLQLNSSKPELLNSL